jgi:BMFP domain-containing protein YqiC
MAERPRFFDDLAGVAGGAFSALAGMREEVESTIRARVDEAIRRLDLVKREDLEAVQEMAARARSGQEAAEARLAALEAKVATLNAVAITPVSPPAPSASASGTEAAPAATPPAATDAGTPFEPPSVS